MAARRLLSDPSRPWSGRPVMNRLLSLLLLTGCLTASAAAHTLNMTRLLVTFGPDHRLTATVDVDLTLVLGSSEAYARLVAAQGAARDTALAEAAARTLASITLQADGRDVPLQFIKGTPPDVKPEQVGDVNVPALAALVYTGVLPADTQAVTVSSPMNARLEFPLAYTLEVPAENRRQTRWLDLPGAKGRAFVLAAAPAETAVAATAPASAAMTAPAAASLPATRVASASGLPPPAARVTAADVSPTALSLAVHLETAGQFLWLGFLHIVPNGADHILFVISLFFLGLKWRPLLTQTTAFTIAHTTTLGLSAYGIFSLPSRFVEPVIALSIAWVAIENIIRPKLTPLRVGVVFFFGLVHGLGFASSLSEVPMPRDQFFTALFAFNFGVDFGQLAIIAACFLAVGWWRDKPWFRQRIMIPICSLIAAIALFWTVQRIFT